MKYIKLFETLNTENSVYWSLRTDSPYFEIGLNNIGMPKDIQKDYLELEKKRYFTRFKFIFISRVMADVPAESNPQILTKGFNWSWSDYDSPYKKYFRNMGEVKITKEDLEEWELKNIANKYNL